MKTHHRAVCGAILFALRFVVIMTLLATWQRVLLGVELDDIIDHPSLLWVPAKELPISQQVLTP